MKKMNNKGFSLVELIIVIAIMAVLIGVLAPQFIKYVESSKQSTDIQNAAEIRAAVEAFVADKSPTTDITVAVGGGNISVTGGAWNDGATAKTVTDALTEVGLSGTTATKSGGWGTSSTVGVYSVTNFKWTPTAKANSKEPKKDIADAFK